MSNNLMQDKLDRVPLIMEAAKRDKDLAKSMCPITFLEEHQAHKLSHKEILAACLCEEGRKQHL